MNMSFLSNFEILFLPSLILQICLPFPIESSTLDCFLCLQQFLHQLILLLKIILYLLMSFIIPLILKILFHHQYSLGNQIESEELLVNCRIFIVTFLLHTQHHIFQQVLILLFIQALSIASLTFSVMIFYLLIISHLPYSILLILNMSFIIK